MAESTSFYEEKKRILNRIGKVINQTNVMTGPFVPLLLFKSVINELIESMKLIINSCQANKEGVEQLFTKLGVQPKTVINDISEEVCDGTKQNDIIQQFTKTIPKLQFDIKPQFSRVIYDSAEVIKKSTSVDFIKQTFYRQINNIPHLLIVNISKRGDVFGCYVSKRCIRKDNWIDDPEHRIFKYDPKTDKTEVWRLKKQSKNGTKAFYFKSEGEYLYVNMGIVIQANPFGAPYSQIYKWIPEHYSLDDASKIVGHSQLFTVVRTVVFQTSSQKII
ncbi:hypothetical protein CL6EHI_189550 [Entamoeba histolytica]|nr:hypothetical protein CL6EHI_189550 [Entamoeba histolytica]